LGMDVWCVYVFILCLCCPVLGRGLVTSWSLVQGVLRIVNRSGEWKAARAHKGGRAIKKNVLSARTVEPEKQPLLANYSETTFISRQPQRNNWSTSVIRQEILNKQQLNSNRRTVFSVRFVPRFYNRDGLEQRVSWKSVREGKTRVGWCEMAASLGVSQLNQ
jgi:hypothetical protein